MLACENAADHLTHFYLFFMPDFTREVYTGRAWHAQAVQRFAPLAGEHARGPGRAPALVQLMGTLGGKWPHTHSIAPAAARATCRRPSACAWARVWQSCAVFWNACCMARRSKRWPPGAARQPLAEWLERDPQQGDLRLFLHIAADLDLQALGRGPTARSATVPLPTPRVATPWRPVCGMGSNCTPWTWPTSPKTPATPGWPRARGRCTRAQGLTEPDADKPGAYTWNKAPRLDGQVLETGALARQLAQGQPLLRALWQRSRGNVFTRVLARAMELAQLVLLAQDCLRAIVPGAPCCEEEPPARSGRCRGPVRGSAWQPGALAFDPRRAHCQLPDRCAHGLELSPRDRAGTPGALEAALVGAPVLAGETSPVAVQHIVRSFDPLHGVHSALMP